MILVFRGFTLIELLVVITIIVVLLALLTPALDKAIYQAELVSCGASQKGIAGGVQVYAAASKRYYPDRTSTSTGDYRRPNLLKWDGTSQIDDRARLEGFVGHDQLLDPLNGRGVIDLDPTASRPEAHVYANYAMWWDWGYDIGGGRSTKLGQRFSWIGDAAPDEPIARFSVLVTDWEMYYPQYFSAITGHADADGVLIHEVGQDRDYLNTNNIGGLSGLASGVYTLSRFSGGTTATPRGNVDFNYAFDDGSVRRILDLTWDEPDRAGRTAAVGDRTNSTQTATVEHARIPYR